MSRTVFIFITLLNIPFFAQSNITYDATTIIDVGSGADICADAININGTWSGTGTICLGPLPVSISTFTYLVNKRDVTLNWVTEWELNNSGFRVERMKTSENTWSEAGFVKGNGTTNEPKQYSFKDEKLAAGKYEYRLKQIDYNGHFEYFSLMQEVVIVPPKNFELGQNYPNPGNPKSKINFEIPVDGRISVKVYDILGKEVMTLLDENRKADYYTIEFDGSSLASGVYFYRIIAGGEGQKFTKTLKMVLVK